MTSVFLVKEPESDTTSSPEKTYHTLTTVDVINDDTKSDLVPSATDLVYFDPHALHEYETPDGLPFQLRPLVALEDEYKSEVKVTKSRHKRAKSRPADKMPSKMFRLADVDGYDLECEWDDCDDVIKGMKLFMQHVATHIPDSAVGAEDDDAYVCRWTDCGYESTVAKDMHRHINYHAFHTKIKSHGEKTIKTTKITPCLLDESQRNVLPELSEPFKCLWSDCEQFGQEFEQAQAFYWHVEHHGENLRIGKGPFLCSWTDCKASCNTIAKLKEHLRTHSQERLVGCPVCGALFASRAKFFDHCRRQDSSEASYECSYCRKKFALERLLREHMRSHINQYKCPLCDMTCHALSGIDVHMAYRHSSEKPFSCEICEYSCKTVGDLNSHVANVHEKQEEACDVDGCDFRCKTRANMKVHKQKVHLNEGSQYVCHVCGKKFLRGQYLTKHLKRSHKFSWPSGHSRFRYRKNEEGLFTLQTVRFETRELAGEEEPAAS